jgi:hypothetical protein
MAKVKRLFYEGQKIEDKIVKEVFRNMAGSEYYITFTDGSWKVYSRTNL